MPDLNPYYEIATAKKVQIDFLKNSSGSRDIHLADGSGTAVSFFYGPGSSEIFHVMQLQMMLAIVGAFGMGSAFGAGSALTNGFKFQYTTGAGAKIDLFRDITIKTNLAFISTAVSYGNYDLAFSNFVTTDHRVLLAYLSGSQEQQHIVLNGANGDKLECIIQDNMAAAGLALVRFYIAYMGFFEKE